MIYKAIIGSRTYGLETEESDVDLAIVSSVVQDKQLYLSQGFDMYHYTPEEFVSRIVNSSILWVDYQWLFPHEFCLKNNLIEWIKENREEMIKAVLPTLYQSHFCIYGSNSYKNSIYHKRVIRAIHFHNMLVEYAEGAKFEDAIKAKGDTKNFLLAAREGKAPVKRLLEVEKNTKARAEAVVDFYKSPRADLSILEDFKQVVYKEVDAIS